MSEDDSDNELTLKNLLHGEGEVNFSLSDQGSMTVLVTDGEPWGSSGCESINGYQVRTLFRWLAGIVLPKVERQAGVVLSYFCGDPKVTRFAHADFPELRAFAGDRGWLALKTSRGYSQISAKAARALAACLLAAADEAEGV